MQEYIVFTIRSATKLLISEFIISIPKPDLAKMDPITFSSSFPYELLSLSLSYHYDEYLNTAFYN